MARRRLSVTVAAAGAGLILPWIGLAAPADASPVGASPAGGGGCSAGAHTLAPPGSLLYPETGNGGYTSLHTLVHLVYDADHEQVPARQPGGPHRPRHPVPDQLQPRLRADVRQHQRGPGHDGQLGHRERRPGPVQLRPADLPGRPERAERPEPRRPRGVGVQPGRRPGSQPAAPACTPELPNTDAAADSMDGTQCPANKLVITPPAPIRDGAVFTVTVNYTGRPGVHNDGDGTTEGWFRASDGGFVTTEPVASEDWMPLNDYPTAKPTYDFSDTVTAGRTVIANGKLVSVQHHAASPEFPGGSVTWNWHAGMPIASYLVEDSVGNYSLTSRVVNGIRFYQAQDLSISAAQRKKNLAIMDMQPDITAFESQFNGPFPFASDGIIIGTPDASFDEEMEGMIAFSGGEIDTDTLYHENMHQWWGDNVSEGGYRMTFYKEGLATLAEFFYHARLAENAAGGPSTAKGRAAFQASLVKQFNQIYGSGRDFWTTAPSNPIPYSLFDTSNTYNRPGAAYIALRQILGPARFDAALRQLQRTYGGRQHHRAPARGRLPPVAAGAQQRLPGAAEPVLHPVVRHRLPGGRRKRTGP